MARPPRRGVRLDEHDGQPVRARRVFGPDLLLPVVGQGPEAREQARADDEGETARLAPADGLADYGGSG